jgi:hypothetical protein
MARRAYPRVSRLKRGAPTPLKQKTNRRRGAPLGNQNARKHPVVEGEPAGSQQASPVKDRAIALAAAQKAKITNMQIQLLERALEPADWKFDPHTTDELRDLQVELMRRHLKRTISPQDFALLNQAMNGLIKIITPAPQAPPVDKEAIIAEYVNSLPAELQNANIAWIRKKAREAP